MKVYYFTLNSFNKHISSIKIGDICFYTDKETTYLWIQDKDSIRLSKTEGIINPRFEFSGTYILNLENPLIFQYDGISKRKGNEKALSMLIDIIFNECILAFLKNIIAILKYKEDRIDLAPILQLFNNTKTEKKIIFKEEAENISENITKQTNQEVLSTEETKPSYDIHDIHKKSHQILSRPPYAYYFFRYLNEDSQNLWKYLYQLGKPLRDIYIQIKRENKRDFSGALKHFNKEFPDLNIYSINTSIFKIEEEHNIQKFKFLNDALINNGFKKKTENIWIDSNGIEYIITIKEKS